MAEPKLRFKQSDGSSYPTWEEVALGSVVSDNLDPVPTPKEGYWIRLMLTGRIYQSA